LGDGIETRKGHLAAFFFGKLRPQDQGPVVELLADDGGDSTDRRRPGEQPRHPPPGKHCRSYGSRCWRALTLAR
jgi:hypothetical protein